MELLNGTPSSWLSTKYEMNCLNWYLGNYLHYITASVLFSLYLRKCLVRELLFTADRNKLVSLLLILISFNSSIAGDNEPLEISEICVSIYKKQKNVVNHTQKLYQVSVTQIVSANLNWMCSGNWIILSWNCWGSWRIRLNNV